MVRKTRGNPWEKWKELKANIVPMPTVTRASRIWWPVRREMGACTVPGSLGIPLRLCHPSLLLNAFLVHLPASLRVSGPHVSFLITLTWSFRFESFTPYAVPWYYPFILYQTDCKLLEDRLQAVQHFFSCHSANILLLSPPCIFHIQYVLLELRLRPTI